MRELKNEELVSVSGGTDVSTSITSPDGTTTGTYCTRGFLQAQLSLSSGGGGGGGGGGVFATPQLPSGFGDGFDVLLGEMSGGAVAAGAAVGDMINELNNAEADAPFIFRDAIVNFFFPELDESLKEGFINGPN